MRLLITGGSGYLGRTLVARALADGHDVVCTTHRHGLPSQLTSGVTHQRLDVCDRDAVHAIFLEQRPHAVIHTAGSDRAPSLDDMVATVRDGSRNVRDAAMDVDARLIHLSTDVVFDGRAGPYREADPPNPIFPYARVKAEAEAIVAEHPDHATIRTSLIYGFHEIDHGTRFIATAIRDGRDMTLFDDQLRNPVWIETLAGACLELADHPHIGVIHIAGRQAVRRSDFVSRLLTWWEIPGRDALEAGPYPGDDRPRDCRLDVSLAEQALTEKMLGVDDVFAMRDKRAPEHE